ncbi:MAG: hydrogenase maturation protease [Candidatus Zixiibacteriota bacterium]
MKPILVLCLGNEVLSDDSFGYHVHNRLRESFQSSETADIEFSSIAGFTLIDVLQERRHVLIVDAISTGAKAGLLHFFEASLLTPSRHLVNSHQISLPSAISLGIQFGLDMPERIDVLAVEAQDIETLSESMTLPVAHALGEACDRVLQWVNGRSQELTSPPMLPEAILSH